MAYNNKSIILYNVCGKLMEYKPWKCIKKYKKSPLLESSSSSNIRLPGRLSVLTLSMLVVRRSSFSIVDEARGMVLPLPPGGRTYLSLRVDILLDFLPPRRNVFVANFLRGERISWCINILQSKPTILQNKWIYRAYYIKFHLIFSYILILFTSLLHDWWELVW